MKKGALKGAPFLSFEIELISHAERTLIADFRFISAAGESDCGVR